MNSATMARLLGVGRIAVGLVAVAQPPSFARAWVGDVAEQDGTQLMTRAFGGREVVLGLLTVAAAGGPQAPAVVGVVALIDVVDAGASIAARRAIPATGALSGLVAAGVAVGSVVLARRLAAEG